MSAFGDVRIVYEKLGAKEPYWAVLSHPEYKRAVVDEGAFFATGHREITRQMNRVADAGIRLERGRALDFGCGVGRLTNALAEYFDEVIGVDISSTMVETAHHLRRNARCSFIVNHSQDLAAFPNGHFDFVFSDITLQHVPSPASRRYLAEFVRILKPGGLVICLVPDCKFRPEGSLSDRLNQFVREQVKPVYKRLRGKYAIQIHPLPKQLVAETVTSAGGMIYQTEVAPDFQHKRKRYKPLYYWIRHAQAAAPAVPPAPTRCARIQAA